MKKIVLIFSFFFLGTGCAHYELSKAALPSTKIQSAALECAVRLGPDSRQFCLDLAQKEADRAKAAVPPIARSQAGWGQPAPVLLVEDGDTIFRRGFFPPHRDPSVTIGWGFPDRRGGCGRCRGH